MLVHPIVGDRPFEVSLLIGVDHYWKLVGDHVTRGDGPTAIQSKLGIFHLIHYSSLTTPRRLPLPSISVLALLI